MSSKAPPFNFSSFFHNANSNKYDRMASGCTASIFSQSLPMFLDTNPVTPESNVLDNAAGTGIVSEIIKAHCPSVPITGVDLAPGMLEVFKSKAESLKWQNIQTKVQDARNLDQCSDETYSHVFTNFGFALSTTDPSGPLKAAKEMFRVCQKGGVAVVTIWYLRNFEQALENAARTIRPSEEPLRWDAPQEWEKGWWLMKMLDEGGFDANVELKLVEGGSKAPTLDELVGNFMCFKDMFYKDYNEEEVKRLPVELKKEIPMCPGYYEDKDGVGFKMIAWIGVARKQ